MTHLTKVDAGAILMTLYSAGMLEAGADVPTVQLLLGHSDLNAKPVRDLMGDLERVNRGEP